jgi:predicted TIM-barrel fold metal-dependent hydrolase
MVYAHRADIYDADTHMMEPPTWLAEFADAKLRPHLAPFGQSKPAAIEKAEQALAGFAKRQQNPDLAAEIETHFMAMKHKGFQGLGAWDRDERVRVNDLLGFNAHIVFPTAAFDQVQGARDPEIFAGSVQALNRGLASFCATDARMHPAAYIPFRHGPELAMTYLDAAIAQDFTVVMIDTIAPQGAKAFTHPDFDPIWAKIQDADMAITIHVGTDGGWDPVPLSFYNNGGSVPEHAEGDAPRDAIAYMGIQYNAELFLAAMIFDGVFHRFPGLRVAVVELGASWIVSWMKHLDQAFRAFRRLQDLSQVNMQPSEYVQKHIKVTPFAGEDIGWLLSTEAQDLLLFASDYPHHEGTDDPIARFEKTMDGVSELAKQKFYTDNFRALLGSRLTT